MLIIIKSNSNTKAWRQVGKNWMRVWAESILLEKTGCKTDTKNKLQLFKSVLTDLGPVSLCSAICHNLWAAVAVN